MKIEYVLEHLMCCVCGYLNDWMIEWKISVLLQKRVQKKLLENQIFTISKGMTN